MKKTDDTEAKQAMLNALAGYTGPITHCPSGEAMVEEKRTCKLSEFGECQREFIPADKKKWTKFCCTEHRKRWHYLDRTRGWERDAEVRLPVEAEVNGHAQVNGNGEAKPKLTLAALGLGAAQTPGPFKRRKLTAQPTEADSAIEARANAEQAR